MRCEWFRICYSKRTYKTYESECTCNAKYTVIREGKKPLNVCGVCKNNIIKFERMGGNNVKVELIDRAMEGGDK